MSYCVCFFAPGIPAPAGSKRAFYIPKLNRSVITDACKRTKPWQSVVSACAREVYQGDPLTGAISLVVVFTMPRPKGHYGTGKNASRLKDSAPAFVTVKPDIDKLSRAVLDALTGICWRDDAQVVEKTARKIYGEKPGVWVEIMAERAKV